jgi:DNA mismatch repair protein MutS
MTRRASPPAEATPAPGGAEPPAAKLTPMMTQYWDVKKAHREAIVLFRMGDFYETFYDDAKIASRVLGLTLTTRDRQSDNPVPLAGVPFHSADAYVSRLLRAGYKVAICEQMEDPALAKGLVRRAVTEVLTPGTALVPALLPERDSHYALCLALQGDELPTAPLGFAYLDFSTGEFGLGERPVRELFDVVARYAPREIFLPRAALATPAERDLRRRFEAITISFLDDASYTPRVATEALTRHFGVLSLDGLGCAEFPAGVLAAGALLDCGTRLKQGRLDAVTRLQVVRETDELVLDDETLANLEIFRPLRGQDPGVTLVHHLDECRTAMGSRLLRAWLAAPRRDPAVAGTRHAAVAWLLEHARELETLREALAGLGDLERLMGRIAADRATPRDLAGFAEACERLPAIAAPVAEAGTGMLAALHAAVDPLADLAHDVRATVVDDPPAHLRDGGVIRPGASPDLDALLDSTREAREWIAGLQESERRATGITKLKVGYNKVFGYYLEVPRGQAERVPAHYTGKQTLVSAQRYVTPELKEKEQLVLRSEAERTRLELTLFNDLRQRLAAHAERVRVTAAAIAALDVLSAFAFVARKRSYCRPELGHGDRIRILGGRHPVVERLLDSEFVPNDVELSTGEAQILLITGPNMGGKSTFLRQVALIVLMAYAGSYVPARSAEIGVVDRIFTRVGASDNLARGQSTFLVEMTETAKILNCATSQSLVVLDEVGRGTSTHDGMSLAWAVVEYLHDLGPHRPRTLFATHYHELTVLEETLSRLRNLTVEVKEWQDEMLFLHRIRPGRADKSYGVQVAKLAGLPPAVIQRAREVLSGHERMEESLAHEGRAVRPAPRQMDLFAATERQVADAIRAAATEVLTPDEALALVRRWRALL